MEEKTSERSNTCHPVYLRMDASAERMRAADEEGRRMLLARSRRFRRRGVIKSFRTWAVTTYGVETIFAPADYSIERGALTHAWWHEHMKDKLWVTIEDFDAALAFARKHFKIKTPEAAATAGEEGS